METNMGMDKVMDTESRTGEDKIQENGVKRKRTVRLTLPCPEDTL